MQRMHEIHEMHDIIDLNADDKLELKLQCPYGLVAAVKLKKSKLYKNHNWHPSTEGLLRIIVGLCVYGDIDSGHKFAIKLCNPSAQLLDSFWHSEYSSDVRKNLKRRMRKTNSYMVHFLKYSEFGLAKICRNWLIYNCEQKLNHSDECYCWRNFKYKNNKNIIFFTCQECRQKDATITIMKKQNISNSSNSNIHIKDVGDPWHLLMTNYFYPHVHSCLDLRRLAMN